MLSALVQYPARNFCNFTNHCIHGVGSRHVQFFVIRNGRTPLLFSRRRKSWRRISSHGRLTESTFGENRGYNISRVGSKGGARVICFCKNDNISEDNSLGKLQGLQSLDCSILKRWDVPWDWITILFTMNACGLSFLLTGLAESAATSYLGIQQRTLMSLDEQATLLFVDRLITTAAGLATIFAFVSHYRPLPDDLFCYRWKEPFSLQNGWLLWGGLGLIIASMAVAIVGVIITILNGKPPQREIDALSRLLPMIGASKISTTCLIGVTGVLAPLFEETMFRGFLMTSLTKWLPTPVAVFISACVFAVAHLTPGEFPQIVVLGAVLGFAYAQTRNLLTPITIHALWNSGVIVFLTFLRIQGYDIKEFLL